MSSGSGEEHDRQIGQQNRTETNKAEADSNSGLIGGKIIIHGSVTINNYPKYPAKPTTQDKVDVASFSEATPPSCSDHLAVLVEYIEIVLRQQQDLLNILCEYFKREGLIEVSDNRSETTSSEQVARDLLAPFSNNTDIPTTARFTAILQDWKNRKMAFSDKGQKDALRAIRDAVFLASLPEKDTQEMVAAICNAILDEVPTHSSRATVPLWGESIAEKLGRYAHAVLMGQRAPKKPRQSFLFEMLNKKFEATDTSIIFDDKIYEYVFLMEPKGYQKKTTPKRRIEEFAKGCVAQLKEQPKDPASYESWLRSYLEFQSGRGRLVFVKVSRSRTEQASMALDDVTNAFTRMVFIEMEPNGNATVYENIMMHMAEIDRLLTELFPDYQESFSDAND